MKPLTSAYLFAGFFAALTAFGIMNIRDPETAVARANSTSPASLKPQLATVVRNERSPYRMRYCTDATLTHCAP